MGGDGSKFGRKEVPQRSFDLEERSDVDPHEKFDPEKLGLEDWGDGFHVEVEPVVIERNELGAIKRTTPISEATPHQLMPARFDEHNNLREEAKPKPTPRRMQEKVVDMMAGLLMRYYSDLPPGAIHYNPLYDGIPADEYLADDRVLEPNKLNAKLVHVPAHEVHIWLKKLLAKRAQIINTRTGQRGWNGDISDLQVSFRR